MLAAMTGPIPSTAANSSAVAAMMASRVPRPRATARAPVGPRWRIPSPTRSRLSGWAAEAAIPATRLAAERAAKRSSADSCGTVRS